MGRGLRMALLLPGSASGWCRIMNLARVACQALTNDADVDGTPLVIPIYLYATTWQSGMNSSGIRIPENAPIDYHARRRLGLLKSFARIFAVCQNQLCSELHAQRLTE